MNNAILHFFFYCLIVGKCDNFANLNTEEWNLFKNRYSKTYKLEIDETLRLQTYLNNKNFIDSHNERFRNGEESYKLGMNQFGDMTNSEFASLMNGYKHNSSKVGEGEKIALLDPQNITLPETVDWRDKGAVTGIKDQGTCGSCWTFSTTGSLEGQQYLRSGKLVSLSEQNIIDCSTKYGTFGCEGGLMENAFQYIRDNGGIDTEESYPYEGVSDKCRYKPETSGATVKGSVKIPRGDEEKLKLAVATIGPISVTIDSSLETFEFYQRGVYYDKKCKSKPEDLDHAVLIVGYGTENGMDYWLVKNSWNTSWGLEGYIKMARNKNNHCGIATSAIYPLI